MKLFKLSRLIILSAFSSMLYFGSSAQDTIRVLSYYKNNYIFTSGFWVYQDTTTFAPDSITLVNIKHGFYGPNPVIQDYREYYQLEYYSHTNDSAFNDFFVHDLWRVNGGGEWAELGQPVMVAGPQGPVYGGYNGFEILDILDSLYVGNMMFYNVAWSYIDEDQQYQHEFNYDTDLFFAEDVGIIRKEYTDDEGVHHAWDLVNWEVGLITAVHESDSPEDNIHLFPNPASGYIHIISNDPVRTELCNLQGEILSESTGCTIDIENLADGIYLVRIYIQNGSFLKVEKVIKHSIH